MEKMNELRQTPLTDGPLMNGQLAEFKEQWPKNNQKIIYTIDKALGKLTAVKDEDLKEALGRSHKNTPTKIVPLSQKSIGLSSPRRNGRCKV